MISFERLNGNGSEVKQVNRQETFTRKQRVISWIYRFVAVAIMLDAVLQIHRSTRVCLHLHEAKYVPTNRPSPRPSGLEWSQSMTTFPK